MQGAGGGGAHGGKREEIVLFKSSTIELVDDLNHANFGTLIKNGRGHKSHGCARSNAMIATNQAHIVSGLNQQRLAGFANLGGDAFAGLQLLPRRGGGIVARLMHQQQSVLLLHQPQVDRLRVQNLLELAGDDRQQGAELQRGVEDFFQVVHLGEPADRNQALVALVLISDGRCQGNGRILRDLIERFKRHLADGSVVAQDFNRAQKHSFDHDGNISQRDEGAANVEVGVIFARQRRTGEDDRRFALGDLA